MRASLFLALGAAILLGGCGFSSIGGHELPPPSDGPVSMGDVIAAGPDVASAACTVGETSCAGRTQRTCGPTGLWDPMHDVTCDFTCAGGGCVSPTNIDLPTVAACGSNAPALDPGPTGTVTYDNGGGAELSCSPACGTAMTIAPVKHDNSIAWFCVSSINLQAGARLVLPAVGVPSDALAFIVDGNARIAGQVLLDGGDATSATAGGVAGPGGAAGENLNSDHGGNGNGCGGGQGGDNNGSSNHWAGGGGGGGGNFVAGGGGGGGLCTQSDHIAATSLGGQACGAANLVPLTGGSGGGAGGDATTGVQQGWAGGGGGGGLQIDARLSIAVTGLISARGGDGYGVAGTIDGGGGGGAGGGVLFESPAIAVMGSVLVDGGAGGPSGAGPGGAGATGAFGPKAGATYTASGQGGSGGGGGGGRVQLNTVGNPCSSAISPTISCTVGVLMPMPMPFASLSGAP